MTESEKIERLQEALGNARKRIETQRVQIEALEQTLAEYARISISVDRNCLTAKIEAVKRECTYGLTHFCDGTVNWTEAEDGAIPLPPCPNRKTCALRRMRIV